jgi:two-component system, OmpR family, osmolarity sensor histidine kinase EnvZ
MAAARPANGKTMATTDIEAQDPQESGGPLARLWRAAGTVSSGWNWFWRLVGIYMPKRLYARSLLIVITPMILLQSVVTLVFMERHWQTVTQRLSTATTRDLAAIIDMIETYPNDGDYSNVRRRFRRA